MAYLIKYVPATSFLDIKSLGRRVWHVFSLRPHNTPLLFLIPPFLNFFIR